MSVERSSVRKLKLSTSCSLSGNAFFLYVIDAKYVATDSGEPLLSWVTKYTVSLSFISSLLILAVKKVC